MHVLEYAEGRRIARWTSDRKSQSGRNAPSGTAGARTPVCSYAVRFDAGWRERICSAAIRILYRLFLGPANDSSDRPGVRTRRCRRMVDSCSTPTSSSPYWRETTLCCPIWNKRPKFSFRRFAAGRVIIPCDLDVAREYGRLKQVLKDRGRPLPENDIWIAAAATHYRMVLVTRDRHFQEIDDLSIADWAVIPRA
jgi:PIN domain